MTTYHERVALAMKATHSAGSLNSYETILEALRRMFPLEDDLRAYVARAEQELRDRGLATADWSLLGD